MANHYYEIETALRSVILNSGITNAISFPNAGFYKIGTGEAPQPSNDETWCRLAILSGDKFEFTINDTDRINGVAQLDVFIPKSIGMASGYAIADLIDNNTAKHVNVGTDDTNVKISTISARNGMTEDSWHKIIISINFYVFMSR